MEPLHSFPEACGLNEHYICPADGFFLTGTRLIRYSKCPVTRKVSLRQVNSSNSRAGVRGPEDGGEVVQRLIKIYRRAQGGRGEEKRIFLLSK